MQEVPRFVQWIYGEAGAPEEVDAGRLRAWAEAFEGWLEAATSAAQHGLKILATRSFLQHLGKPPWQASPEDVQAWTEAGREAGNTEVWLGERLWHLSSFYDHCQASGCDPAFAGQPNPVQGLLKPHLNSRHLSTLSPAETRAFLQAIHQDVSLPGRRDYALFILLLLSGRKVQHASRLRWGDLQMDDNGLVFVRWPGSPEPVEMPLLAQRELGKFLKASGRLEAMQPDWSLFPPLTPGANLMALQGQPGEWANTHFLTKGQLINLLRQYAAWAGLQPGEVRFATLRNTAILSMAEEGMSRAEMVTFLGFSHRKYLNIYLSRVRTHPKAALWSPDGPKPHAPRGEGKAWATQGVHPGFKHGIYSNHLPEPWLEELFEEMPGLRWVDFKEEPYLWEIGLARLRSQKILEVSKDAKTLKEMLNYTQLMQVQAGRMMKAVKKEHGIKWKRKKRR